MMFCTRSCVYHPSKVNDKTTEDGTLKIWCALDGEWVVNPRAHECSRYKIRRDEC